MEYRRIGETIKLQNKSDSDCALLDIDIGTAGVEIAAFAENKGYRSGWESGFRCVETLHAASNHHKTSTRRVLPNASVSIFAGDRLVARKRSDSLC
jgi:hypothetical protein